MSDKTRALTRTQQTEVLRLNWFNFRTQEHDDRETPEDFTDYIPQNRAAQSLYRLLVDHMEHTPLEAAREVLKACCPMVKQDD